MLTHNKCHKLYLGDKFNLTYRFDNKLVKIVKKNLPQNENLSLKGSTTPATKFLDETLA